MRPRLTYANVMATIAVFISLGGASYAALNLPKNSVGPKQLKKNAIVTAKIKKEAVTAAKVKKGTLTGTQINVSTLGTVPSAQTAQTANSATALTAPEPWHLVGAPGEPQFQHGWKSDPNSLAQTVAFYKDQGGVVHLRGRLVDGENSETAFQLPPGYRPAPGKQLQFAAAGEGLEAGQLIVQGASPADQVSGAVYPYGKPEMSLEGVSFRAEG